MGASGAIERSIGESVDTIADGNGANKNPVALLKGTGFLVWLEMIVLDIIF
ncbi:hypothetical protein P4V56_26490 [Brevibacillus porteri]|uniref:hypothetical protein n=1 Tax=Brevibacillus porteri TaxID=2126350 RepID=UPI002E23F1D2|nr:hypothetical protein [Brevibacillus porteri]